MKDSCSYFQPIDSNSVPKKNNCLECIDAGLNGTSGTRQKILSSCTRRLLNWTKDSRHHEVRTRITIQSATPYCWIEKELKIVANNVTRKESLKLSESWCVQVAMLLLRQRPQTIPHFLREFNSSTRNYSFHGLRLPTDIFDSLTILSWGWQLIFTEIWMVVNRADSVSCYCDLCVALTVWILLFICRDTDLIHSIRGMIALYSTAYKENHIKLS